MTSSKRAAEPSHPAPYLPQSAGHHARHSPSTSDSTSTHTRRQRPRKQREDRYEEEIQFNIAYFSDTRGQRRPLQSSRMAEEEYPPPPAYERATAASVSTLVSEDYIHETGPSLPVQTAISVPSTPVIGVRQHADRSDSISLNTVPATQTEEDMSSIEEVDIDPAMRWELERQHGVPLEERGRRNKLRTIDAATPIMAPHRPRLFSQPTTRRPTGMQFHASQLSLRIPEDHDRYDDDRAQDNSDLSSPPTPKHPKLPHIPVSPPKLFHIRSQSPQASSSVISLLRNPSPFFKSTPSLLSLPPTQHGNHSRSRKIFHRKSKEEPLEDWEVLENVDPSQSSVNGTSPTPQTHTPQRFPTAENDRVDKTSTIQMPQTPGSNVQRGSPPFVARHVRRHTNSGRSGQMSAPVSPVSVSSVSTFSTSTTTSSQTTPVEDDAQQVVSACEPQPEVRSTPRHGTSASRVYDRTPRISSPAPPSTTMYEHDPELPVVPCGLGALPARSATERIVRVSESREGQRGRSVTREMGMRSAPAYSMLFPSGPPFPLPGIQTPPQEVQTLPPPPPCKCPSSAACSCASSSASLPFTSGISATCPPLMTSTCPPGFTIPQPSPSHTKPSSSVSSCPQTPRKHYPGRPLPATPPVSPSLTWILDGQTHVQPHPRAANAAFARGQSFPWAGTPILPEKSGLPCLAHTPPIAEPAPQYSRLPEKAPRTPPMSEGAPDTPAMRVTTPCTPPMPGMFSRTPPIPESKSYTTPILGSAPYSPPLPLSLLSTPPVPEGLLIDLSDDENSPDSGSPADVPTSPDLLDLLDPPPAPVPKCVDLLDFRDDEELSQEISPVSPRNVLNNDIPLSQAPRAPAPTPVNFLEDDPCCGSAGEDENIDNSVDEDDGASDSGTVSPPGPLTPSMMSGFVSASGSIVSLVPVSVSVGHAPAMRVGGVCLEEDAAPARDSKPHYAGAPRLGTPRQRPSAPTAC
ncbi:hypothetical protein V8B97DRAFT_1870466 [Scleroderma yunnanense]